MPFTGVSFLVLFRKLDLPWQRPSEGRDRIPARGQRELLRARPRPQPQPQRPLAVAQARAGPRDAGGACAGRPRGGMVAAPAAPGNRSVTGPGAASASGRPAPRSAARGGPAGLAAAASP